MNYTMTKPCDGCPFRRGTDTLLRKSRIREIVHALDRGEFPCHKTVDYGVDDDGGGDLLEGTHHCAGALIFLEKTERPSQMMRICERLGLYDASKLMADGGAKDEVFDDLDEMMKHHLNPRPDTRAQVV